MSGLGVIVVVLVIAGALVGLVRVADAEVSAWRADRDEVRRLDRLPPSSVELPPAVTGVRPAPVPVLYDWQHEPVAELVEHQADAS